MLFKINCLSLRNNGIKIKNNIIILLKFLIFNLSSIKPKKNIKNNIKKNKKKFFTLKI